MFGGGTDGFVGEMGLKGKKENTNPNTMSQDQQPKVIDGSVSNSAFGLMVSLGLEKRERYARCKDGEGKIGTYSLGKSHSFFILIFLPPPLYIAGETLARIGRKTSEDPLIIHAILYPF